MEEMDMRNMILSELIDKMHSRMADKMFPPNPDMASEPAASGIPGSDAEKANAKVEKPDMGEHGDDKGDMTGIPSEDGEMSDEDLDEMMKGM